MSDPVLLGIPGAPPAASSSSWLGSLFGGMGSGAARGVVAGGVEELRARQEEISALITGGILNPAVDRAVERLQGAVVSGENSVVHQLRQLLCGEPHAHLVQCKEALGVLQQELSGDAQREQLVPLLRGAATALEQLETNRVQIGTQIGPEAWGQLQGYRAHLGTVLNAERSAFPTAETLRTALSPVETILTKAYENQQGVCEQFAAKLSFIPQRMLNNFTGASPSPSVSPAAAPPLGTAAAAPVPASAAPPAAPTSTAGNPWIDTALSHAGAVLSNIASNVGGAVSQRMATQLATWMVLLLSTIRETLERNNEQDAAHKELSVQVNTLIQKMQGAQKAGAWGVLSTTLQECFEVLKKQQIFIQNFPLPLNPVSRNKRAIPDFLENITEHDAALQNKPLRPTVTPAMIAEEALKLQERMASFAVIRCVAESICGVDHLLKNQQPKETSEQLYASLLALDPAVPLSASEALFRTRLFQRIDASDLSTLRKWLAKRVYGILLPISSFFVKGFLGNAIHYFEDLKKNNDPANPRDTVAVKLFRNWLAILSGSYNQVANAPHQDAKDFTLMLQEAVHAPERNYGLCQSEIYAAFAQSALETLGPKFQWRHNVTTYFKQEIDPASSFYFLNPMFKKWNELCRLLINPAILIPEWLCNQAMQWSGKLFLRHNTLLQGKINQMFGSLSHNTPTSYAFNQMISDQLRKLEEAIENNLKHNGTSEAPISTRYSEAKKLEISRLVEYLFEVLNKSKYSTQDRLELYLRRNLTLKEQVEKEIDEASLPKTLEIAANSITIALDTCLSDEGLNEILYNVLMIANGTFESTKKIEERDFADLEKGIRELSDNILGASISYALDDFFDFTKDTERKAVRAFCTTIKEDTQAFVLGLRAQFTGEHSTRIARLDYMEHLKSVIEKSTQFQRARTEALRKVDGDRYLDGTIQQKLNAISNELASHCKDLGTALNTSARSQQYIDLLNRSNGFLETFQGIFQTLETQLCHPSQPLLTEAQEQQRLLAQTLADCCHKFPFLTKEKLTASLPELASSQNDREILTQALPLFERLHEKKQSASNPPTFEGDQQLLRQLLGSLSPHLRTRLLGQAEAFFSVTSVSEIQHTAQEFKNLHSQSLLRTNEIILNNLVATVVLEKEKISAVLAKIGPHQTTRTVLTEVLTLFQKLRGECQQTSGSLSPASQRQRDELLQRLNHLPESLRMPLLASALGFFSRPDTATARKFEDLHSQALRDTNRVISEAQQQIRTSKQTLEKLISQEVTQASCQIASHRRELESLITAPAALEKKGGILHCLKTIENWGNALSEPNIFSHCISDMKWINDRTKELAFDRAQTKVKQILEALYQKHNYTSALHHLVIFPFLQKHGEKYLKQR